MNEGLTGILYTDIGILNDQIYWKRGCHKAPTQCTFIAETSKFAYCLILICPLVPILTNYMMYSAFGHCFMFLKVKVWVKLN